MRAVLVFCEGNHDVRFVSRSLVQVAGAQPLRDRIGALPWPFGDRRDPRDPRRVAVQGLLTGRLRRRAASESLPSLSLQDAGHPGTPSVQRLLRVDAPAGQVLYGLVHCGTDADAPGAHALLRELLTLLQAGDGVREVAAAFLFDADDGGRASREAAFARDHGALLGPAAAPRHGGWTPATVEDARVPVGLYIFHDPATGQGSLEDQLAPLVAAQWPARWAAAGDWLRAHAADGDPVKKRHAAALKAQIGITGQPRFPGAPMTEVIDHKGLDAHHFRGAASVALVDFLQRAPWAA